MNVEGCFVVGGRKGKLDCFADLDWNTHLEGEATAALLWWFGSMLAGN